MLCIQKRRQENKEKETEFSFYGKLLPLKKISWVLKKHKPSKEEAASPNLLITGLYVNQMFLESLTKCIGL
jgi:hypothetical protein